MRPAPRLRFLSSAGACVLLGGWVLSVQAQSQGSEAGAPLRLKASPRLSEALPADDQPGAVFVFGERVSGNPDVRTVVEGQSELRKSGAVIRADRLEIEEVQQLLTTQGPVRLTASGNRFTGSELHLRLDTLEGFFTQPSYVLRSGANGQARRIDFLGEQRLRASQASYTSCERDNEASWRPDWVLSAERFDFDVEASVGRAYKPVVRFQDVPVLGWAGSVSFPLSDQRKSGLLPPTFALDTTSGLSVSQPYYMDIAPNRDATLTPTLMSKRGLGLGTEFRYLEPQDQGVLRTNLLPFDRLAGDVRWSLSLLHSGYRSNVGGEGQLNYRVNFNRVSDDNYWRDFPYDNKLLSRRLLPADVQFSWSLGDLGLGFRTLSWQTLQSADSVIRPPYDRLPQLTARYGQADLPVAGPAGLDWSVDADFTRFQALRSLTQQTNADRVVMRGQLSLPWRTSAFYLTPKLQLHATQYAYAEAIQGSLSAHRLVPTFSLDSGVQFERPASFFGRSFTQTLEPRALYVYTPYRDQRWLPNYDSAEHSFNFASLFIENSFMGHDRIADANLLTVGVESRLLEADTGVENLRLGVAQRLRFADQLVTLDGSPASVQTDRLSDLLVGGTFNWNRLWALNFTTQYNPESGDSKRSAVGVRYSPGPLRVLNVSYKRQQPLTPTDVGSQQLNLGWQWPLADLGLNDSAASALASGPAGTRALPGRRWYSVGRLNFSAIDRKLVDSLVGVEFDGCCWVGRLVLQRSTRGATSADTQIMAQLEFVGFSRIGNNPLTALRHQIPGYQILREQETEPSRFSNYE